MNVNHYIGFDVHKKTASYCVKTADGTIVEEASCERRTTRCAVAGNAGSLGMARWRRRCSAADLRHVAALSASCRWAPSADESHRRLQEEKRQAGCAENRDMCAATCCRRAMWRRRRSRAAADAALPQPGGRPGNTHEEQDERDVDGVGAEYNKRQLHGKQYFTNLLDTLEEVPES